MGSMTATQLVVGVVVLGLPVLSAGLIGERKNRLGFAYGFLSWVGVLLILLLPARSDADRRAGEVEE